MSASAGEQSGKRTGVLGGTFDPVHLGHLAVADHACSVLALDRIIFIPAARPPHKPEIEISSFAHRAAMLRLALEGQPEFVLSCMEEKREGPSYSIDTLQELRATLGEDEKIFFLIGMDAFAEIDTWKEFRRLPQLCDMVVIDRSDLSQEMMEKVSRRFGPYAYHTGEKCWICPGITGRIHYLADRKSVV